MEMMMTLANIVCIPITISILAIAFPLLLQTSSKIDDKYGSTRLTDSFYKEKSNKIFITFLIINLFSISIWIFRQPRLIDIGIFNIIVDNSAFLLLATNTFILIFSLFKFVRYIKIYYNPEKLLILLIENYHKSTDTEKRIEFFKSVSDLLFYSIENENEEMARTLVDFFSESAVKQSIKFKKQNNNYTDEFYDAIFAANEKLCLRERKTTSYFNGNILVNLFIDGYQETTISEKTFSAIWRCLRQDIHYGNDDFVMSYWKNAHQYFDFFLQRIPYKYGKNLETINKNEVENRDTARKRFLEFHYALGGLLYSQKRYDLIKRIMEYTNQNPPEFHLVPDSITKIIYWYTEIGNILQNPFYYEITYPFPNVDGANSDGIIRSKIKDYISILLLKQYTLHDYYIGQSALDIPHIPDTLPEINRWKNDLVYLKYKVSNILSNKKVLKRTGLGFINSKWFEENNKLEPISLLDEIIKRAEMKYQEVKSVQSISKPKKQQFEEKTREIINRGFQEYSEFNNQSIQDYNSIHLKGLYQIMEKEDYADNQEIAVMDADTIVAEMVMRKIHHKVLSSFLTVISQKYTIRQDDIFNAIDLVIGNLNDATIISFGVYLPFYISVLKNPNLTQDGDNFYYKGIKIISFNYTTSQSLQSSFVVLEKEDLPNIIFNPIEQSEAEKYKLSEIDESTHLSTNIVDLNEDLFLREEVSKVFKEYDLTKNVIVCIGLNSELRWKKSAKCILIRVFDQFTNSGNPNNIKEIKS
jgi:hypothetical protein